MSPRERAIYDEKRNFDEPRKYFVKHLRFNEFIDIHTYKLLKALETGYHYRIKECKIRLDHIFIEFRVTRVTFGLVENQAPEIRDVFTGGLYHDSYYDV